MKFSFFKVMLSRVVLVMVVIPLLSSHVSYAKSTNTSSEQHNVADKRSLNALLDHISDLQDLSRLSHFQNNIPSSIGLSSTSGNEEDFESNSSDDGPNYDSFYDDGGSDDKNSGSGGRSGGGNKFSHDDSKKFTSSSAKSPFNNKNKRPLSSSGHSKDNFPVSPFPQFPPPLDVFRGYNSDSDRYPHPHSHVSSSSSKSRERERDDRRTSFNRYDHDDEDRGGGGYLDNAYYRTDGKRKNQESYDAVPFYPSHGIPNPPLDAPREYRLPLYSSNNSLRGSGKNYNAIPNSNHKSSYRDRGESELGFRDAHHHDSNLDESSRDQDSHGHGHVSSANEKNIGSTNNNNKPSHGRSGLGGFPFPPMPPRRGGIIGIGGSDRGESESNPRGNKASQPGGPDHTLRGYYGVLPSPYGRNVNQPEGLHGYGTSKDYGESEYSTRGPTSHSLPHLSPGGQRGHHHVRSEEEEEEDGYGGLAERHSMIHQSDPRANSQPKPFRQPQSKYNTEHGFNSNLNSFKGGPTTPSSHTTSNSLNLHDLNAENDYQTQLQLTNAATFQALQGLSGPSPTSNNYPVFNNALNGLSTPSYTLSSSTSSSLYDGLAGYGIGGGGVTSTGFGGLLF